MVFLLVFLPCGNKWLIFLFISFVSIIDLCSRHSSRGDRSHQTMSRREEEDEEEDEEESHGGDAEE
jgi:hypothetical protein